MATSTTVTAFRKVVDKKEQQIQDAMREAMRYMLRRTKRELNVSARQGEGVTASAPGEYPHKRSGGLTKSLRTRIEKSGNEVVGIMGSTIEYAPYLEEGTESMDARPVAGNAIKDCLPGVRRIFAKHLKK